MINKYLLSSVYCDAEKEAGADPEAARKAEIQKQRDSIKVTSVKIEDQDKEEDKEEVETKEDDKEEEKEEDKEEDEGEEKEEVETKEEKELTKEEKKIERLEKKIAREAQKRREAEKALKEANAKLEADPEKKSNLTEEDVEKRSEAKAQEKQLIKEFNAAVERLADGAQKTLKMKTKEFDALVEEVTEELGAIPSQIIGILDDLDNGPEVLAHMFKNPDEAEEIYKLANRPAKLGLELAKLSTKLSTPKPKKISQVPDPVEPLGGKSAGGDRLAILSAKKNKTAEEMSEWVQVRNADIAQKRANGRSGLR